MADLSSRAKWYLLLLPLVLVAGCLAVILVEELSPVDALYFVVVTVATVGYGDIVPRTPAGKLIVVLLIVAGVGAFLTILSEIALLRQKVREVPALFFRDHVILCGINGMTGALVQHFSRQGRRSVVVGQGDARRDAEELRQQGIVVIPGDPRDPRVLSRAGIRRAGALLAFSGSDSQNAEIILSARKIRERQGGEPLSCIHQVTNPALWKIIREEALAPVASTAIRVNFFNETEAAARVLVSAHFSFLAAAGDGEGLLLVVIGVGRLGEAVTVRACRSWYESMTPGRRLDVLLVDRDAGAIRHRLLATYPLLARVARVDALPTDVLSSVFQSPGFLDEHCPPSRTIAFVCLPDDIAGLAAALALSHHLADRDARILVRMDQNPGLARFVKRREPPEIPIIPFSTLSLAARPELVLGDVRETLARAIHDQYLATAARVGSGHETPSAVPWDELPDPARESSRLQAESILEKVRAAGCEIMPLTDWDAPSFAFTPEEVEFLAAREHQRWMAAMAAEGYSYGPVRDDAAKKHPSMVPYEDLPEPEKEKDRDAVRMIPRYLALIDMQVYRPGSTRQAGQ